MEQLAQSTIIQCDWMFSFEQYTFVGGYSFVRNENFLFVQLVNYSESIEY